MSGDLLRGDLVQSAAFGAGKVEDTSGLGDGQKCLVRFSRNDKPVWVKKEALEKLGPAETNSYELVKLALRELSEEDAPRVPLGQRWQGGQMILKPGDETLSPHSFPVETFFHKIVMIRDRLRVLEQQINANQKLSDEEKVGLQQYITRSYGSLTSFNILFKNKEDHFVGQKGEK
jgi:hypothetical protein